MFRKLRIAVLLLVLVNVAVGGWLARARTAAWDVPLRVAVLPIAADDSPRTAAYLDTLSRESFEPVQAWFAEEGGRSGLALGAPVEIRLSARVGSLPPPPPFGGNTLEVMLWSLQLRWWAWRHGDVDGPQPHVRLFALYHDPDLAPAVPHSVGLQKGMLGVVHVFATRAQAAENLVVLTHELLHTLGATDKYDPGSNLPRFPEGYAEPDRSPREPQEFAEIMAGRIPVAATRAEIPRGLGWTVVGDLTAREIGWRH